MNLNLRKFTKFVDKTFIEGGKEAKEPVLLVSVAAVIKNPWSGKGFVEDLKPTILDLAPKLGDLLVPELIKEIGSPEKILAYGKAGVVGLDAITGQVRWSATKDPANYASPILTKFGGKASALFFTRQGLVCLNPKTGEIFFKHHWRPDGEHTVNASTPIIMNNLIFVSASYGKGATVVEVNDGKLKTLWANNISMSCQYASCVIQNGYLYGFHGRQERGPELRCVSLVNGSVRWTTGRISAGNLLLADGKLLVLTEDGEFILAAASPRNFKALHRQQLLGLETRAHFALSDGRLFARDKRLLVCLNLKRGTP